MCDNWKTTADMFQCLFEKPQMKEKLLCKPPFKYLFDIVMETQKATNFAKGLFNEEELNAAFYSDRDKKILFLKKLVDITQLVLKEEIPAKPSKIVAGLEPENTNILLQGIYNCATQKDKKWDPYVRKVLKMNGQDAGGEEPPQQQQQEPPKKKSPPKEEEQQQEKPQQQEKKQRPKKEAPPPPPDDDDEPIRKVVKKPPPKKQQQPLEEKPKQGGTRGVIQDGGDAQDDNDEEEQQAQQKNTFKKVDKKGGHGAYIQNALKDDDDDLVQKEVPKEQQQSSGGGIKMKRLGKTKKSTGPGVSGGNSSKGNADRSGIDDVENLTKLVQSICQNANPLGKSLEFINDDIESMNNELQHWNKQYQASKEKMQKELRVTEDTVSPLQDKLMDIDLQIQDEKAKISNMKTQIIKNQFTIQTLLHSVVVSK